MCIGKNLALAYGGLIPGASWPLIYGPRLTLAVRGVVAKKCKDLSSNPNFRRLGYGATELGYGRTKSGFADSSTRCRLSDWGTWVAPLPLGQSPRSGGALEVLENPSKIARLGSLWGSLGLPFELKGVTLGSRVLQNGSQEAPKTPKCSKKLPPRGRSGKISEKLAI